MRSPEVERRVALRAAVHGSASRETAMKRLATTDIGAWCAILMFPVFIAGGVLMSASGASDLIPGTGHSGGDWLTAVAFDGVSRLEAGC